MTTISRHQQPIKRRDDTRIGRQHAGLGQQMKITTLALLATATAAATIGLAATTHADESYDFFVSIGEHRVLRFDELRRHKRCRM